MKKLLGLLVIVLFIASCNTSPGYLSEEVVKTTYSAAEFEAMNDTTLTYNAEIYIKNNRIYVKTGEEYFKAVNITNNDTVVTNEGWMIISSICTLLVGIFLLIAIVHGISEL